MFLKTIVILLIVLTINCIKAEIWKFPTAADIETSMETCHITNLMFLNLHENSHKYSSGGNSDLRCFSKELGLWSDDEGFKAQRFVKALNKYHQPIEILIVIDFCNNSHKQTDLDKWANEAFKCFAKGRMGLWISEYVTNIYNKKITT